LVGGVFSQNDRYNLSQLRTRRALRKRLSALPQITVRCESTNEFGSARSNPGPATLPPFPGFPWATLPRAIESEQVATSNTNAVLSAHQATQLRGTVGGGANRIGQERVLRCGLIGALNASTQVMSIDHLPHESCLSDLARAGDRLDEAARLAKTARERRGRDSNPFNIDEDRKGRCYLSGRARGQTRSRGPNRGAKGLSVPPRLTGMCQPMSILVPSVSDYGHTNNTRRWTRVDHRSGREQ
jgi:hypothetical protein